MAEEKMNIWGVGRGLIAFGIIYFILAAWISWLFPEIFIINFIPRALFYSAGVILLLAGIPFWAISGWTVLKGFGRGKLLTKGVFSYSRNPIYASFILFLIPGMGMFFRSWLILTVPAFMTLLFLSLIKKEENFLEEEFGEEYLDYKKNVHTLLSFKKYKGYKGP